MIDIQKYIINGEVATDKIALGIKYRDISRQDIETIADNPVVKKAFFGKENDFERLPKEQWDRKYLDRLSYAAIGLVFNKEYMLYLNEVAEVVAEKEKKSSHFHSSKKQGKTNTASKICFVCILLALLYGLIRLVGPIVSDLMKGPVTETYSSAESEEETR